MGLSRILGTSTWCVSSQPGLLRLAGGSAPELWLYAARSDISQDALAGSMVLLVVLVLLPSLSRY